MSRATPGIKTREWHRKLRRHGCTLVRTKGGHAVYEAPDGTRFVTIALDRTTCPTFKCIEPAAKALGLTIQEVLR